MLMILLGQMNLLSVGIYIPGSKLVFKCIYAVDLGHK